MNTICNSCDEPCEAVSHCCSSGVSTPAHRHLIVGAGAFGAGLSRASAFIEWAWRADVDRLDRGITSVTLRHYQGDDDELTFPPTDDLLWDEVELPRGAVEQCRTMARAMDELLDDTEYAVSQPPFEMDA